MPLKNAERELRAFRFTDAAGARRTVDNIKIGGREVYPNLSPGLANNPPSLVDGWQQRPDWTIDIKNRRCEFYGVPQNFEPIYVDQIGLINVLYPDVFDFSSLPIPGVSEVLAGTVGSYESFIDEPRQYFQYVNSPYGPRVVGVYREGERFNEDGSPAGRRLVSFLITEQSRQIGLSVVEPDSPICFAFQTLTYSENTPPNQTLILSVNGANFKEEQDFPTPSVQPVGAFYGRSDTGSNIWAGDVNEHVAWFIRSRETNPDAQHSVESLDPIILSYDDFGWACRVSGQNVRNGVSLMNAECPSTPIPIQQPATAALVQNRMQALYIAPVEPLASAPLPEVPEFIESTTDWDWVDSSRSIARAHERGGEATDEAVSGYAAYHSASYQSGTFKKIKNDLGSTEIFELWVARGATRVVSSDIPIGDFDMRIEGEWQVYKYHGIHLALLSDVGFYDPTGSHADIQMRAYSRNPDYLIDFRNGEFGPEGFH